jgi:hypothetical protein
MRFIFLCLCSKYLVFDSALKNVLNIINENRGAALADELSPAVVTHYAGYALLRLYLCNILLPK